MGQDSKHDSAVSGISIDSNGREMSAKQGKESQDSTESFQVSNSTQQAPPPMPSSSIQHTAEPRRGDRFRSTKVYDQISPIDGKTNDCDRGRTFDSFLPSYNLGDPSEPQKRVGHTWEVIRAVGRLKKPIKKVSRKVATRRSDKDEKRGLARRETDRERLLSVA
ncbi:hypothetical protein CC78DRAFT_87546 [Lojkania enalia]|uniref:Uncharacterized protein n=1 Tax=Lojkania enalia TaxID=147567 RepID=A0A9P4KEQ6_9PLEO|nr:hypothetical protein CC78DRAFT_87546 [Didymosphaeria enalia]